MSSAATLSSGQAADRFVAFVVRAAAAAAGGADPAPPCRTCKPQLPLEVDTRIADLKEHA